MNIEVIPTVDEIKNGEIFQKTVIIIDVLRTSSTIISALANGCKSIIPAETVGQAKAIKNHFKEALLVGDRYYKKIPGFDLSNSPTEMLDAELNDRTIILTTSNGIRGIQKAEKGEMVIIGGFLNGVACVKEALERKNDLVLLLVGDKSSFVIEDGLAAGFYIDLIKKNCSVDGINDFGVAMYGMYKYFEQQLQEVIKNTEVARKLSQYGHEKDIEYSVQRNILDVCPIVNNEQIITILER